MRAGSAADFAAGDRLVQATRRFPSDGTMTGFDADSSALRICTGRNAPARDTRVNETRRTPSDKLIPHDGCAAVRSHGQLRMPRRGSAGDGYASARRKRLTVARRRIEQRLLRLTLVDERCPRDVDDACPIHGQRRAVLGAAVQLPLVFAHSDERIESPPAVGGLGERDVAHAARKDVAPCGIDRPAGIDRHRSLATETDAGRDDALDDAAIGRNRAVVSVLRRLPLVRHARMRCGFGHLPFRVAAVEPHGVDRTACARSQRFPSARTGQRGIVCEPGGRERATVIRRARDAKHIATGFLRAFVSLRPEHGERVARSYRHARGLFVVRSRVAIPIVDASRLREGRTAIVTRRQVYVRRAVLRRRPDCRHGAPRNRQRRRRVHRPCHAERRRRCRLSCGPRLSLGTRNCAQP